MPLEHGFYFMLLGKTLRPGMSILFMLLLTSTLLVEMTSLTFDSASRRHFVQDKRMKYYYFNDFPVFSVQF